MINDKPPMEKENVRIHIGLYLVIVIIKIQFNVKKQKFNSLCIFSSTNNSSCLQLPQTSGMWLIFFPQFHKLTNKIIDHN